MLGENHSCGWRGAKNPGWPNRTADSPLPGSERAGEAGEPPGSRRRDALPEGAQSVDTILRRIAGNDRRVDRADRNARHPVGGIFGGSERLIDAGLIAAKGPAALQ